MIILYGEVIGVAIYLGGLSLGGLILDILGVFLLVRGEMRIHSATLRQYANGEGKASFKADLRKEPWFNEILLWFAGKLGSKEIMDRSMQTTFEEFPLKAWGLFFLFLGFLLQGIATALESPSITAFYNGLFQV